MVEHKPHRLRSDSTTVAVAAAQAAKKGESRFKWPLTWQLPDDPEKAENALRAADDIFALRPPPEWSQAEISIIAELAILSADLSVIQKILSDTNYLVKREGKGGRMVASRSPLLEPAQHISTRRLALSRSLGLTGSATNPRGAGARAQVFTQIADGLSGADEFSLLAQ